MKPLTEAVSQWNETAQQKIVEQAVGDAGTSIMRSDKADVGWLQVEETRYAVTLKQIFLLPTSRNLGLGTSFLKWMQERADRKRKDLSLDVLNNNPARHLYERLGFRIITTAGTKITMRY